MITVWRVLPYSFFVRCKKLQWLRGSFTFLSTTPLNMDKSPFDPPTVTGMKLLDKALFKKEVLVPCLKIGSKHLKSISSKLNKMYLKIPNLKPTQSYIELKNCLKEEYLQKVPEHEKFVLFDPTLVHSFSDIECQLKEFESTENDFRFITLLVGYDNWNSDKILRAILPPHIDNVTSYSLVGHIIHLNLRDEVYEYKEIIAQVLLDKVKQAKTVVNKVDNIDNTFRNFRMEILGGLTETITRVKENSCIYEFDFSQVFWNPRLSTEHERIVNKVNKGDILYDIFAGVGPFSIPVAKKGCKVFANDLNPESCKWLQKNCSLNKVEKNVSVYCKDGGEFIRTVVKENLFKCFPDKGSNIHITMNLPADATSFLSHLKGLFSLEEIDFKKIPKPILYVYCFSKGLEDPKIKAKNTVETDFGISLNDEILDISLVRNVAPNKDMMRVTLFLNERILCYNGKRSPIYDDRNTKKICM